MTIRYTCQNCGSKLNIKEELAGTEGKCPKCKTVFQVPAPAAEKSANPSPPAAEAPTDAPRAAPPAKAKMPARPGGKSAPPDADFDPVEFLMQDDAAAGARKATPLSDDEIPAALELEVSDDDPPRRRGRPRRRVNLDAEEDMSYGSASVSAGAMLSGGASAGAARDLLTRTVEESRARAATLGEEQDREPSAALMIARELLIRGLPGLLGIAILAYGFYLFVNSLVGGGIELPDLGKVSGTITLDGKPLAGATILFNPIESEFAISETRSIQTRSSTGVTDEDGRYELIYMEGVPGAVVGEHRVSISKLDGARELAPSAYGPYSVERRTVEAGSNTIDFPLTSDR